MTVPRSCGHNSLPSTLFYGQPESWNGESAESNENQIIYQFVIYFFHITLTECRNLKFIKSLFLNTFENDTSTTK